MSAPECDGWYERPMMDMMPPEAMGGMSAPMMEAMMAGMSAPMMDMMAERANDGGYASRSHGLWRWI